MQLTEGDDVVITDASQPNKLRVSFFTTFSLYNPAEHGEIYRSMLIILMKTILFFIKKSRAAIYFLTNVNSSSCSLYVIDI